MLSTWARQLAAVWLFLSVLTLVSWQLSAPHGEALRVDVPITLGVLAAAYVKSRLIVKYFMEVRTAARDLKVFCEIWLAAFFGTIALVYALGT